MKSKNTVKIIYLLFRFSVKLTLLLSCLCIRINIEHYKHFYDWKLLGYIEHSFNLEKFTILPSLLRQ